MELTLGNLLMTVGNKFAWLFLNLEVIGNKNTIEKGNKGRKNKRKVKKRYHKSF
jgi:hypothetical protein